MSPGGPSAGYGLGKANLDRILSVLAGYPAITQVILFGSRAKGNYRPGSDIDICLDAPTLDLDSQLEIETHLDDLLLPWKIDLLLRHHIDNTALRNHIERVGIKLAEFVP